MKVAIIADSHFDEHSRFEECIGVHNWIADDCEARGVDLVIHTGDVFERKSTPRERNAVAAWLMELADSCPVIIVRGNHDVVGDLAIFSKLESAFPIVVEEMAGLHPVRCRNGEPVDVAAVAWPRKGELLALAGANGQEVTEGLAADALRNVLRGLGDEMAEQNELRPLPSRPRILAMHAMVRGSMTSVGQPLVGCDMELGLEDLACVRADFVALGHIHMPQDWAIETTPVVYPGSPRRTAFGEVETKGYIIAEFDGRTLVRWERVETPCAPMVLLDAAWTDGAFEHVRGDFLSAEREGAEVRFRYSVTSDAREPARDSARLFRDELLGMGVAVVKLEEQVITETRSRSPEVVRAVTLEEKLAAFWRVKAFEPGERRDRLIAKAHAVEEEVRNAG